MKKHILIVIVFGLSFNACNNPNKKEISELDKLIVQVNETEKELLSVDTSRVFSTKRLLESDLAEFNKIADTLNREDAFKISDIFGNKKKLYRLSKSYPKFVSEVEKLKSQLSNLKQDLENEVVAKDKFIIYYAEEQSSFNSLNKQINKLIGNIDITVDKYELDRPELLELIERLKQEASAKND